MSRSRNRSSFLCNATVVVVGLGSRVGGTILRLPSALPLKAASVLSDNLLHLAAGAARMAANTGWCSSWKWSSATLVARPNEVRCLLSGLGSSFANVHRMRKRIPEYYTRLSNPAERTKWVDSIVLVVMDGPGGKRLGVVIRFALIRFAGLVHVFSASERIGQWAGVV